MDWIRKIITVYAVILGVSFSSFSSDDEEKCGYHLIVVPGKSGTKMDHTDVINIPKENHHFVKHPTYWRDLGQERSICLMKETVDDVLKTEGLKGIIFLGESLGTATILNFLGRHQNDKFKAVILQGVFASGGSGIPYYASKFHEIKKTGFARFWAPQLARLFYPGYDPFGPQPITSLASIQKGLYFFIVHSKYDQVLPFSGAEAIHSGLTATGKNSTIMPLELQSHLGLILWSREEYVRTWKEEFLKGAIYLNVWLEHRKLPFYKKMSDYRLVDRNTPKSNDQPDTAYRALLQKTRQEYFAGLFADLSVVSFILYMFYWLAGI